MSQETDGRVLLVGQLLMDLVVGPCIETSSLCRMKIRGSGCRKKRGPAGRAVPLPVEQSWKAFTSARTSAFEIAMGLLSGRARLARRRWEIAHSLQLATPLAGAPPNCAKFPASMRPSNFLLVSIGLLAALPALAESATDAPAVVVLRGSSAPPAPPPPVVVQTVVYPEIVYVPTYYPALLLLSRLFHPAAAADAPSVFGGRHAARPATSALRERPSAGALVLSASRYSRPWINCGAASKVSGIDVPCVIILWRIFERLPVRLPHPSLAMLSKLLFLSKERSNASCLWIDDDT